MQSFLGKPVSRNWTCQTFSLNFQWSVSLLYCHVVETQVFWLVLPVKTCVRLYYRYGPRLLCLNWRMWLALIVRLFQKQIYCYTVDVITQSNSAGEYRSWEADFRSTRREILWWFMENENYYYIHSNSRWSCTGTDEFSPYLHILLIIRKLHFTRV